MNFSEFFCQVLRCNTIAQFPAGAVIDFAERKTNKTSFQQIGITQNALMRDIVKDQVFIYFIADDKNICPFNDLSLTA